MEERLQHLTLWGVALFACPMVAYGAWVVLTVAKGRPLSLGEIQLGILALLGGSFSLYCLFRVVIGRIALLKKNRRGPMTRP